ncbi:hypothetical protein C8Q77DRAFT_1161984 [Trametes polyzona]|nr:hypothetical protein C8Q77DRAFT_1161984 [Trametes polyzona]
MATMTGSTIEAYSLPNAFTLPNERADQLVEPSVERVRETLAAIELIVMRAVEEASVNLLMDVGKLSHSELLVIIQGKTRRP